MGIELVFSSEPVTETLILWERRAPAISFFTLVATFVATFPRKSSKHVASNAFSLGNAAKIRQN